MPLTPLLTIDALILYKGRVVLIRRGNPPFEGEYALPGGFVEIGERVEEAVVREAREETGLDIEIIKLVGVYSDPGRDPRGHTVSLCYLARGKGVLKASSDARDVRLFDLYEMPKLAFDHSKMIKDAKKDIEKLLKEKKPDSPQGI